jgi:hypothetical protein
MTKQQKQKLSRLWEEYDANLSHLNYLRKLNAWNPIQSRLSEHGQYLMWHRALMMEIFQVYFEAINRRHQEGA